MIAGRFELVIFDCDGVLVDSEPIINRAHADVLTACGYPITERDLVERFCGMSDSEMLAIVEREWGHALPLSYTERVGVLIENGFCQSLAAIEGVAKAPAGIEATRGAGMTAIGFSGGGHCGQNTGHACKRAARRWSSPICINW